MLAYFKPLFLLFVICPMISFSQATSDYNANTFLIQFDADTNPQEILDLKTQLGAQEIGMTPVNGIRMWQVSNFPIDLSDTNGQFYTLTDIVEVQGFANRTPKVNGTDLNYQLSDSESWNVVDFDYSSYYYTPTPFCSDYSLICPANIGSVKVGYIDTGLETTGHEAMIAPYYQEDYNAIDPGSEPTDNHGHGTQMAGIAAATLADQGLEDISLGGAVQLIPLKAMNKTGSANLFHIIYAIEMAKDMGVDILNLSFGYHPVEGDASELLELALRSATEAGILVICSAGNDDMNIRTDKFYPACFSNRMDRMITVGAIQCNGAKTNFTNWNKKTVQIGAPGEDILAPVPGGEWVEVDGSSHSAAIVTNIAALIGSHLYDFNADVVEYVILESAFSTDQLYNKFSTGGYVDAEYALSLLYYYYGMNEDESTRLVSASERVQDNDNVPNTTNIDTDLANVATTTSNEDLSLSAFPNPFIETVHLKIKGVQQEIANIEIFDAAGQLVKIFEKELNTTNTQIIELELAELETAGLYHIKLSTGTTVLNTKVFKK